jgi:hypothetical protein
LDLEIKISIWNENVLRRFSNCGLHVDKLILLVGMKTIKTLSIKTEIGRQSLF